MHVAELEKHELQRYRANIEAVARECVVGVSVDAESTSHFGGLPAVDRDFVWPMKKGYPLNFVGQLECSELDLVPVNEGCLLFFYDNRHWGYSPGDLGHAIVLHQHGERQLESTDLPQCQVPSLFGLIRRTVKPNVYARVNVIFASGRSYPSWERETITFDDDGSEECYIEFCCDVRPDIQLGGYPHPIQSDEMERDCIKAFDYGQPQDWQLLLQLFEIGDMMWGDAGALYWFIHKDDLKVCRFDRVWMVSQCH